MRCLAGMVLTSLGLVACSGSEPLFLPLPELDQSTERVILAVECGPSLQVRVYEPVDLESEVVRIEDCEEAQVTIFEYATSLDDVDLPVGPVSRELENVCAVAELPAPELAHTAHALGGESEGFTEIGTPPPWPGTLSSFKYRRPCPCRPLEIVDRLSVPLSKLYYIEAEPNGQTFLVFGTGPRPYDRIEVYRSDLSGFELIDSSTIAIYSDDLDYRNEGFSTAEVAPDERYYLTGDFGQIFSYTAQDGLRLWQTVPSGDDVNELAVSQDPDRFELYAVTLNREIWRYRETEGWFQILYESNLGVNSSQRGSLAWQSWGRVLAGIRATDDIVYIDEAQATVKQWTINGAIHAAAQIEELGVVAGTRRNQVFQLPLDRPGVYEELLGPSGEGMQATEAWFRQIRPIAGGFLSSLDGPDTFLRFHKDWGYCPLSVHDGEDVTLSRFASQGEVVLAGGDRSDFSSLEVFLPVLRFGDEP